MGAVNAEGRRGLRDFYILWITQSLSQLGSAMTEFALTLWLYEKTGSALSTAALRICTYAPYVIMSVFSGAVTDRFDKKRTMLACDALAALTTVAVYILYRTGLLSVWHLYAVNAVSGLMNTVQEPASEVAYTLVIPKEKYQMTGSLRYLSRSVITVGSPLFASALFGAAGLDSVIAADLISFALAFFSLLILIRIPAVSGERNEEAGMAELVAEGVRFLRETPLLLNVILFMSGVNLIASAFDAVLPALVIPFRGNEALGIVMSCSGAAMILGSLISTVLPAPKDRIRVIYLTMLFSLGTENFLLAFSRNTLVWCFGQMLGWMLVPIMSVNLNVVMRNIIPVELQGRVYAFRNSLQFFTIPIGLALGGFLTDEICEPFMQAHSSSRWLTSLFGSGKGSGASFVMFILGVAGIVFCLFSGRNLRKYNYSDEAYGPADDI